MANRSSQDNARSLSPSRSRRFVTVETCQRPPRRVSMPRLFSPLGDCPEAGRPTRANIRNHRCKVLRMPVRVVEDPFVLAVRKGHPLAERERLTWANLAPFPLITVHRSSANRILLNSMLAESGLSLHWTYSSRTFRHLSALSRPGSESPVLPRMATRKATTRFLSPTRSAIPNLADIGVVRRRGASILPAAATFMNILIGAWGDGPANGNPAAA